MNDRLALVWGISFCTSFANPNARQESIWCIFWGSCSLSNCLARKIFFFVVLVVHGTLLVHHSIPTLILIWQVVSKKKYLTACYHLNRKRLLPSLFSPIFFSANNYVVMILDRWSRRYTYIRISVHFSPFEAVLSQFRLGYVDFCWILSNFCKYF